MTPTKLSRRLRVWSAVIDQVFSSGSNGVFTFAVAVASTTETFGEIVLMMTALVAVLGAQRGALGTPLLLKSDQPAERVRREGSYALLAALATGCVTLGVMASLGYEVGLAAVLLAAAAPIVLCQDVLRYVAIAEGRPQVAATWDGVWFLGSVLLLGSAWLKVLTVPWLIGGWAALGLISLIGLESDLRILPRLNGFAKWLAAGWQHRLRYGIEQGLEQTTVFLVLAMAAVALSPTATASLRGATVLLAPIAVLVGSLQTIVISESTRNSAQPRTVWFATVRWLLIIIALTVAGGVVLCLLPVSVGAYILGESFAPAQHVLPVVVVEYCSTVVVFGISAFLKTFNRSMDVMRLKIGAMVVSLVGSTSGALLFHSARGVAAGLTVGTILICSLGLAWYVPWEARTRTTSVDIAERDFTE